jgi:hypothetical protein
MATLGTRGGQSMSRPYSNGRGPVDIVADPIDDRWYVTCAANAVVVLEQ